MRKELVRCYYGNLDGLRQGLIVASSQKEAAAIAKVSLYAFREYWGSGGFPKDFNPAPRKLYTRPYYAPNIKWAEGLCEVKR